MRASGIKRVGAVFFILVLLISCTKGRGRVKAGKSKANTQATISKGTKTGTGKSDLSSAQKDDGSVPPYNNGVTRPGGH
jgi:hypothetical protein